MGCYWFRNKVLSRKAKWITPEGYIAGLKILGFSNFIILKRRNYLRKVVSVLVAEKAGHYHISNRAVAKIIRITLDCQRVEIDHQVRSLLNIFEEWDQDFIKLDELLKRDHTVHLEYENDILEDPLRAYGKICDFLDIDPGKPDVTLGRTTPFGTREIIENYSEVFDYLNGTKFEWMLEETA